MDIEVLQKYKTGGGGEYVLVYRSEGKDDPFGDMDVQDAVELQNEIAISMTGEVLMATVGENNPVEKLIESYGSEETVTMASYIKSSDFYSPTHGESITVTEEGEEEEEEKTVK